MMCGIISHSTKRLYFPDVVEPDMWYDKYPILKCIIPEPPPPDFIESFGSIEEMCKIKGIDFEEYIEALKADIIFYDTFTKMKKRYYGF